MLKIHDHKEKYIASIPWKKVIYIKFYPNDPSVLIRLGNAWERINLENAESGVTLMTAWERYNEDKRNEH